MHIKFIYLYIYIYIYILAPIYVMFNPGGIFENKGKEKLKKNI